MRSEKEFQECIARICEAERAQAELFRSVLDRLEDPELRAVFERLHRDEVSHEKSLEEHK